VGHKHLLIITLPLMLVAAFALLKGIPRLASAMQAQAETDVPLAPDQMVQLSAAGEWVLSLRGRWGTSDFSGARFTLRDEAGAVLPSNTILVRASRTGMDGRTTLSLCRFTAPAPGRYRLETRGIDVTRASGDSRLVLARPAGAALFGSVAWVLAAALALLGSVVLSSLAAFAQTALAVHTPAQGSPVRVSVVDVLRLHLGIDPAGGSRFKVFHLKTDGVWSYFEGNEVVRVEGDEWQETDRTVKALLQFEGPVLRVRALWSLPDNDRLSLQEFERQLLAWRSRARLPEALFPTESEAGSIAAGLARQAAVVRPAASADPRSARPQSAQAALLAAIKAADLAAAQAAVAQGASVRTPGDFQRTPLHHAVLGVKAPLVEWMLAQGADANAVDGDGRTPLHRSTDVHLQALLRSGADLKRLDRQGNTALHVVAQRRFGVRMCELLVDAGVAVNARNHAGLTALHFAVLGASRANLEALVRRGAELNVSSTAEHSHKDFEIDWQVQGTEEIVPAGSTPLSLARLLTQRHRWTAGSQYDRLAEFLISKGAVERKWWQFGSR
jgi:hypothetical protein